MLAKECGCTRGTLRRRMNAELFVVVIAPNLTTYITSSAFLLMRYYWVFFSSFRILSNAVRICFPVYIFKNFLIVHLISVCLGRWLLLFSHTDKILHFFFIAVGWFYFPFFLWDFRDTFVLFILMSYIYLESCALRVFTIRKWCMCLVSQLPDGSMYIFFLLRAIFKPAWHIILLHRELSFKKDSCVSQHL